MFHPVKPRGLNVRTMMKMAPVTLITLLVLCCCCVASTDSQDGCDSYAKTGGTFTVPINVKVEKTHTLKWIRNSSIIYRGKGESVFPGNKNDVDSNGSLKLTNLNKTQSGTYSFEVHNENGKKLHQENSLRLCILDPVTKPTVAQECLKNSQIKFTCKVTGTAHTTLEWYHNNKLLSNQNGPTLTKPVKELSKQVTCKVSNKASSETSDPVTQGCGGFPDTLWGYSIWIFVGGGAGIVVVLIIIVIICCVQARRKKRMRFKDENELRLGWAIEETQNHHPHHHHQHDHDYHNHNHHHQQQQPAGHTGPRQSRSKQQRNQQRGRLPEPPVEQPQPSPRRPAQALPVDTDGDEENPPPLPQPRKKGPRTQRV